MVVSVPTTFAKLTIDDWLDTVLTQVHILGAVVWLGGYNQVVLLPQIERALRDGDRITVRHAVPTHFPKVALVEAVLGFAVLCIVPFLTGSARKESGSGAAAPFDGRILFVGLVLVATMLASFWATGQLARARTRRPHLAPVPDPAD
ncbi:hypothetical protein [Flexivirga caeni]|uniref:Copper resistance protein D domain-containing protein n=1 Tax=Flexivirga caeni TaxID=2294115 RepID=A0A3M9MGE5_9MICO|nr:hypothetical protein [Flexivirga caeni]RNI23963.1 hypothetical protein EFY87_06785 [Flexivirga caeni]